MTSPTEPSLARVLFGAYAMAPADPAEEQEFYAGVAQLDIRGLELPLTPEGTRQLEPEWIRRNVQPHWDLVLTCIPTTMAHLGSDGEHGLASTDDDARGRALTELARARDLALRLADDQGRTRVLAIEVHSAPGPGRGSREAFARSLSEVATWDLGGTLVLTEHCDARVPRQTAAKGFLSLEDEITSIRHVIAQGTADGTADGRFGLSINWGRSAIEGRQATTAVEHVTTAAASGLLRAVFLSGATDEVSAWGPAWGDAHIPPRGPSDALAGSSASLLGPDEIRETLAAAGPDVLVGVKVSVRPRDADVPTRLAVAAAALAVTTPAPAPAPPTAK